MKILFVAVEVAPYAKVGGLADVAGSLPRALADLGHDVRVVMPAYGYVIENEQYEITKIRSEMLVQVNPYRLARAELYQADKNGIRHWFIDSNETFAKASKSEEVYAFGRDDYLTFTHATFEACEEENWVPDVISSHDWHTGFFPVILRETKSGVWNGVASTYTIHNLAYQGEPQLRQGDHDP
ncbi:MAG: glycogen/starch synthase [Fimbriimonadaceae bacterium]|nr:glycogen/starch synthase [Fimbriimonadaceae bacterium]